jgi:hypothetical protein
LNKYFIIIFDTFLECDSYYRSKYHPKNEQCGDENDNSFFLVVSFESEPEELPNIIYNSSAGHYFCNSNFKNLIEYQFIDISFEKVTRIWNSMIDDLWKINFDENICKDFMVLEHHFIVSETALEFLKQHNIFKEHFIGEVYGKTYNIYSNIFEINNNNYQEFIKVELPKLRKRVEEVRNEIDEEYSRRTRS